MSKERLMKSIVHKLALKTGIDSNQLYKLYGLEQMIKRIAKSPLSKNFIFKGGYLISSVHGLTSRSTKDLDSTLSGKTLNEDLFDEFKEFIVPPTEDGDYFEIKKINDIRSNFEYPGFSLSMIYHNGRISIPVTIDITSGEKLLPIIENAEIPLMFEDGFVRLNTYSIEQILADKLYTTLAYGQQDDTNSRAKDLYDIYFLTKSHEYNAQKIYTGMKLSQKQRGTVIPIEQYGLIINYLENSKKQRSFWENFTSTNSYAKNISFETVFKNINKLALEIKDLEIKKNERNISDEWER